MIPRILNPRHKSLMRGAVLTLLSLVIGLLLSDFPENHPSPFLVLPTLMAIAGTVDHVRCMQKKWSFYHGGVLLLIYMDMMVISMLLFFLLYPYAQWLTTH
ncbi:MAG TPA: permease [Edaphobacter sp.]